jgi:exodeoxyribonuclease-3
VKIVTWNVNGIRARHGEVLALIDRERPDVVCLQELKARPDQVPETLCDLAGYWCYWHGAGAYSGVGLHVSRERISAAPEFRHPPFDHETRIVEVTLGDLVVASVYVPNGGKDYFAKVDFLRAMEEYAAGIHAAGRSLVLCGDLNVAHTDRDVHPKERKPNAIGQLPEERGLFDRILGRGLVDVGRALDPDNQNLFTWWAPWRNLRQRNIGWRLDYVLASTAVAERAESCPAFREVGTSDHAPVIATFRDL